MTISFSVVQTALDTYMGTLTGLPTLVLENSRIKTQGITAFMRTQLAPAETLAESIGSCGTDRLNGLYIVDLFYPKDEGTADANSDIDILTLAFEAGTQVTSGSDTVEIFNSFPTPSTPNLEKFYMKQVLVQWRARRARTL